MTYRRIETVADLPSEGPLNDRAREKSDLDFKVFADKPKMWEHAKDTVPQPNPSGAADPAASRCRSSRHFGGVGQLPVSKRTRQRPRRNRPRAFHSRSRASASSSSTSGMVFGRAFRAARTNGEAAARRVVHLVLGASVGVS